MLLSRFPRTTLPYVDPYVDPWAHLWACARPLGLNKSTSLFAALGLRMAGPASLTLRLVWLLCRILALQRLKSKAASLSL
jgi:hypothetical protein